MSCGTIFFIREKTCARIRSHIETLGSNTRDIGVLFLPAVLVLPALTLRPVRIEIMVSQAAFHHRLVMMSYFIRGA